MLGVCVRFRPSKGIAAGVVRRSFRGPVKKSRSIPSGCKHWHFFEADFLRDEEISHAERGATW